MQPIYNELINFWKENGLEYDIYEGTFWLDNSIIKAFDKKGNLIHLYRVSVNNDLTITFKKSSSYPKKVDFNFETWEETITRIKPVFYFL